LLAYTNHKLATEKLDLLDMAEEERQAREKEIAK